jgi:hypothetical protein
LRSLLSGALAVGFHDKTMARVTRMDFRPLSRRRRFVARRSAS